MHISGFLSFMTVILLFVPITVFGCVVLFYFMDKGFISYSIELNE